MKIPTQYPKLIVLAIVLIFTIIKTNGQEIQIAMDNEGKTYTIDSKLEKEIQLFSSYEGFNNAFLFKVSDTSYVLEISYQMKKILLKNRETLTYEEMMEFRKKVSERIKSKAPKSLINQEGFNWYLINNTLMSSLYYAPTAIGIINPENPQDATGIYLITASAGFFIPYFITKNKQVTKADATLSFYGQSRGILHGSILSLFKEKRETSEVAALGMTASILEGVAGFHIADKTNMTHGRATAIGVFGDFGAGIGLGLIHSSNLFTGESNFSDKSLASGVLLGSVAGITSSAFLTDNNTYSRGDALILRTTGLLGAGIPATVLFASEFEGVEGYYSLASTLGSLSGLAFGHFLAKENNFTSTQGLMVELGSIAGGALSLGASYAFSENPRVLVSAAMVGSLTSFALLTKAFSKKNSKDSDQGLSFDMSINPAALYTSSLTKKNSTNPPPSFFSAKITF